MIQLYGENNSSSFIQESNDRPVAIEISRNLTGTMMKLEKLIFRNNYIVNIDRIEDILISPESKPKMLFLETVIRKIRENNGIVLSSYQHSYFDPVFQKKIFGKYDIIINVDSKKLSIADGNNNRSMYYTFSNKGFEIRSSPESDTDKIKDIFRLTTEEKEELDKIVSEQIKDLDLS